MRDVKTDEVAATFADRDMQDAGPLDLTRLTLVWAGQGIMKRWSPQFVDIADRIPGEMITDPTVFTLWPV
ncbi:MAG: hypothetical protein ACU83V_14330 [Gammaproteobacteria bacterium]